MENLKSMISFPRLYLVRFFDELKRQVDMAYADQPDETKIWFEMIGLINLFEAECFKIKLNKELLDEIENQIQLIESQNDTNSEQLIEIEELKIKTVLFANKTIIFLPQVTMTEEPDEQDSSEFKIFSNKKLILITGIMLNLS